MEVMTKAAAARELEFSKTWVAALVKKGVLRTNDEGKVLVEDVQKEKNKRAQMSLSEVQQTLSHQVTQLVDQQAEQKSIHAEQLRLAQQAHQNEVGELKTQMALQAKDLEIAQLQTDSIQRESEKEIKGLEAQLNSQNQLLSNQAGQIQSLEEDKRNQAEEIREFKDETKALRAELKSLQAFLGLPWYRRLIGAPQKAIEA